MDHRRVNLYLRVWLGWCARRTQDFILIRAERLYVQFAAARVTDTWFVVGVTNRLKRERIRSLSERVLRARLPLSRVLVFFSRGLPPFHGAPCFPFYRRRESADYNGGKGEEREREGFQDRWVLLLLHTGPADPVDVNRDGSTSWSYSSLAPYASVICRSWPSIPSQRTLW